MILLILTLGGLAALGVIATGIVVVRDGYRPEPLDIRRIPAPPDDHDPVRPGARDARV